MNMHNTNSTKEPGAASGRGGPQSVGRVISILESLVHAEAGSTLSELAANTGAPKTSLVGLLSGLTSEGCLVRDDAGRYALGPRFISLAMQTVAGRELIVTARPVLMTLVEQTGETAVLGALSEDGVLALYLDKVESPNAIRYAVNVGEHRELYCTVVGKVLLAYFNTDRLDAYLNSVPREQFTQTTITGKKALKAELAAIRRDGLARSADERVPGASGVSAPIFGADGGVLAAILIAGPSERVHANAKANERAVMDAAAACTRLVGGRVPAADA